ncbi:hypothetical protein [Saccharothrix yanglingensis]|uniref:Uncharacterized protein n=1 Tax=Saccharothrix yanglingensis TaxID=659496 RepID=A0ABU0X8N1_9PSEU|nr:hypothetical protein [Saccharothrix yanglingensis]MDQ2588402.1 hypothetical protein [Saccharothrix yanglingensis]
MSGSYSFLPWLRTGLTTRITGEPGIGRAGIPVQLELSGDALEAGDPVPHRLIEQPVQLYGPGDVIGIDRRAISRMEPPPFATNFEPNYLAHVEFYEEDFAWRYSPAAPNAATKRLTPWLALIVLSAGGESGDPEFEDGSGDGPLPFITVTAPGALPPPGELGAWAHVHVNGVLHQDPQVDDATDMGTVLSNLTKVLRDAPDSACSRLLCPRHLEPTTTYHAFLVPAFETGRRAGLGMEPGQLPAATPSWGVPDMPASGRLPHYHRWQFTTSAAGDFEYLARLLKPVEAKEPVGLRDVDAHQVPGFGLPELTTPTEPSGVLRLGGALQLPDSDAVIDDYENWDNYHGPQDPPGPPGPPDPPRPPYPNQWQRALAGLINLAEAYRHAPAVTANTTLSARITDLAGQVDPVITPPLYGRWHALTPTLLTEPDGSPKSDEEVRNWVHRLNLDPRHRVAAHFGTKVVQARQEELMDAAWQQLGEARRANAWIRAAQLAREVGNILHGKHIKSRSGVAQPAARTAAEPLPSGRALTLTAPAHPTVLDHPDATLVAAEPEEVLAVGFKVAQSRVARAPVSPTMRRITRPGGRLMRTLGTSLDTLLARIDAEEVAAAPSPEEAPPGLVTASRLGGRVSFRVTAAASRPELGVATTTSAVLTGLAADRTVMKKIVTAVNLPARLAPQAGELTEVMAYPRFDTPMYTELLKMGTDTFVPNLGLLPPNSVTLLENNRRFIESYLVGLNHEMARELLWREYPTDQRGTPFRQFWDPRPALPRPKETAAARRERLYDIPPVHDWGRKALLGHNPNPKPEPGDPPPKNDLVLVIRGELLRKYPTAAVYAHKAAWPDAPGQPGVPDMSGERTPAPLPENVDPPPELIRLPIYEAKVEPDIYLLGFDLDADEARGGNGDLGWFFVLEERPGDPRFGLDEDQPGEQTEVEVWNDLSWGKVDPAPGHGFIRFDGGVTVGLDDFNGDEDDPEKALQREDDEQIPQWHPNVSAADVAYILFQAPVLVAMHAQEMLPDAPTQP